AVLRLCHERGQAVVTHGGLTGLVGGARAGSEDIVISLERMRRLEPVDVVNRTVTVEAGVVLQTLHEAAERAGLMFPLDLGARGSCTIGGNISTNAGGNSVIRYGMMREQVLGIEAVMADGTIVSSLNTVIKNNTGYDLKQLFIGSEGTLGIVTRAVLRLRPLPRSRNTALVSIDGFAGVCRLLQVMDTGLGGTLSAFEVLWNDFYQMIVGDGSRLGLPLPASHDFYVLIEATGSHDDIDRARFERALEEAFEEELIVDAVIAQNQQQRAGLWAIRDDIENMMSSLHPAITFDISLGIPHMDTYVTAVRENLLQRWPECRMVAFGHIGDGNIHLVLTVGSTAPEVLHAVDTLVYGTLQSFNGVISAEHGIGLHKRSFLPLSRKENEIKLMRSLKQALDPKGILNPGKIFATGPGSTP
ncbi:MAG TPA: FAD-binding oxidoreductase, partial [Xanthomonadales bacterium]|nr:FAD-binding oxidoreductase [Xanthomonadales bacterium]